MKEDSKKNYLAKGGNTVHIKISLIRQIGLVGLIRPLRFLRKNRKKALAMGAVLLIVLSSLAAYITFFAVKAAEAAWFDDAWHYRKKLTVDNTKVSGSTNLTNFPVLVSRTDTNLRDKAQSDGDDILFTDINGVKLDHEIEKYNSSTGELVAWVRIPTLLATEDTSIYLYYGNPSCSSQQNPTGVWSSNYLAVWHLNETVTDEQTTGTHYDSTSHNIDGTQNNNTNTGGQIANGQVFDGTADYINFGDVDTLDFGDTADFTVSAWVNVASSAEDRTIVSKKESTGASSVGYLFRFDDVGSKIYLELADGAEAYTVTSATTITLSTWYYVAAVWDQDSASNTEIYINGNDDNATDSGTISQINDMGNALTFRLGAESDGGNPAYGTWDEIRIANTTLSADWINTEYNSQYSPSTFFSSVGSEEKGPSPQLYLKFDEAYGTTAYDSTSNANNATLSGGPSWWSTNYLYRKNITITAVSALSSGFTAEYVASGSEAADIYNDSLSSGNDFRVLYWNGSWTELDRDLQSFTSSSIRVRWSLQAAVSAGASSSSYYFYYDYSGAGSPPADVDNIYRFADDFNDASVDTDKWNTTGTISESGGVIRVGDCGLSCDNLVISKTYQVNDGIMEYRARSTGADILGTRTTDTFARSSVNSGNPWTDDASQEFSDGNSSGWQHAIAIDDTSQTNSGWSASLSTWYYTKVTLNGVGLTFTTYADGFGSQQSTISYTDTGGRTSGYVGLRCKNNRDAEWDWFYVKDYVATEPTVYVSFEETQSLAQVGWRVEDFCLSRNCLFFDGINNVGTVTNASSIDLDAQLAGALTFQSWVRVNSDGEASAGQIFNKGTSTYLRVTNEGTDGLANLEASLDLATTDATLTISDAINLNRWQHIVMTYTDDGDDEITIYIDGHNAGSSTNGSGAPATDTNDLLIGGPASANFHGFLDEFKVYKEERTAAQIATDFIKGTSSLHGAQAAFGIRDYSYLSNGLVGYWKLDEASTGAGAVSRSDSSGNANTLTDNNTTPSGTGKSGNGADFEVDYSETLSITDASQVELDLGQTFTIAAWINIETFAGGCSSCQMGIVGKQQPGAGQESYRLGVVGSNSSESAIRASVTEDGSSTYSLALQTTTGIMTTATWYHIAWVNDGQNAIIYLNGAQSASQAYSGTPFNGTDAFEIGDNINSEFDGIIDDVRIFRRGLSPAEVSALYNWAPGPVGYWKMDEGTGTAIYDSSGNGTTSTFHGSPTWTKGKIGQALSFNGSTDYIDLGNPTVLDITTDITVEAWVYFIPTASWGYHDIVAKGDSNTQYMLRVQDNGDGTGYLEFVTNGSGGNTISASLQNGNNWYHVVGAADVDGNNRLYINGILADTDTSNGITSKAHNVYIGNDSYNLDRYWKGIIDEVRIYNYVRTSTQIIEDMNAGHPAPGSPIGSPVARWKLDEGYGTTAQDTTDNNNDLTLNSASWTASGKFGMAWNGTGGNLRMSKTTDSDLEFSATDDFTLSLWYKSDATGNPAATEYLMADGGPSGSAGYALYATTAGYLCFGIDDDTSWGPDVSSCTSTDVYDATWHQVTAIRNVTSDTTAIYLDSSLKDSDTDTTTATLDSSPTFYIGDIDTDNAGSGEEFAGDIDEVQVFRSALTSDQVKLLYNQGSSTVWGATSTDSSGNPTWSAQNEYCPPGQTSSCTAPVGYWKLDENTGSSSTNDSSGNNITGTFTGTGDFSWVPGKFGSGIKINGSNVNHRIELSNSASVKGLSAFTVEAWAKSDSLPPSADRNFLYSEPVEDDSATGRFFMGQNNAYAGCAGTGVFSWHFRTGDSSSTRYNVCGATAITTNTWYHVAAIFDSASDLHKIYINGVLDGSLSQAVGAMPNTDPAWVPAIANWADGGYNFTGSVDDVRLYNYARSPAQIAWDYNRGKPVGWWKMDEYQGATAYDASGNSNNGTLSNGDWSSSCRFNYCFATTIDATQDAITITDPTSGILDFSNTQDFTTSIWVKASSLEANATLIWKGATSTSTAGYALGLNQSGSTAGCRYTDGNGSGLDEATGTTNLTDGNWHHITCVMDRDGSEVGTTGYHVFVDGLLQGSDTSLTEGDGSNAQNPILGEYNTSTEFTGAIDEAKIFNYALNRAQLKTIYNEGAVRYGPATGSP